MTTALGVPVPRPRGEVGATPGDTELVCEAFGLGEPRTVTEVSVTRDRCLWQLATSTGSYAVERHSGVDPRRLDERHRVRAALAAIGLPVPAPLPTGEGFTLLELDGGLFAASPWAAAERLPAAAWPLARCQRAGEVLGEIHLTLEQCFPSAAAAPDRPTVTDPAAVKARIDRLLGGIAEVGTGDDLDGYLRSALERRRDLLTDAALRCPVPREFTPAGYSHGRYGADTVLFAPDGQVAAVIDWRHLGVRAFGVELARAAILGLATSDPATDAEAEPPLSLRRAAALVAGYLSAAPRLARDWPSQAALVADLLWWQLACDLTALERCRPRSSAGTAATALAARFRRRDELVTWWHAHRDEVAAALSG